MTMPMPSDLSAGFGEFADDEYTSGVYRTDSNPPLAAVTIIPATEAAPLDDSDDDVEVDAELASDSIKGAIESTIPASESRTLPASMQGVIGLSDSLVDLFRVIDRV